MEHTPRRRPVTITISEDVIQAARALSLNTSQAAEHGIREAVRTARAQEWLNENASAIDAYNADVSERGVALRPLWQG